MKKNFNRGAFFTASALVLAPFLSSGLAHAVDLEEVPVEKVFVPARGYDDNDNVVIRVEGTLPDPCYVLGNTSIKVLPDKTFEVHQFAWRRNTGVCAGSDDLPESDFSEDVSLGQLNIGDYKVIQHPSEDQTTFRSFSIAAAKVNALDDFNYANVTQASVSDVISAGTEVKVTFSGTFSSSCNSISAIKVEQQADVFVVRPIEQQGGDCGYILKSFTQEVDLGVLPQGEYMVHIRAKNGRAVERTFLVLNE